MKKVFLVAALTASLAGYGQNDQQALEGNGIPGSKTFPVRSFESLKVNGIFDVELSQGGSESVKLEADENLLQYVSVTNDGSSLVIDMDKMKHKNFKSKVKLKLYIGFKELSSISTSIVGNLRSVGPLRFRDVKITNKGVGDVDLELSSGKFYLKNAGVGSVSLKGKAESAEILNSGVGSVQAGGFVVQQVNIENSGIGSSEVHAVKEIKSKSTGMGSVKNKGAAPMPKKKKTMTI